MADVSRTDLPSPDGDRWVACVDAALPVDEASRWVVLPGCGAVVTFLGTARDHAGDRTGVRLLEYEAYTEQVVPALQRVAGGAFERFEGLGRIAIWHRTGALAVTDVAVVVAVATPHRAEAFAAASWAIDEVKATAPIWKREHHDGGIDWGRCDHDRPSATVVAR
jgi:molybdopterin synthase catalytic subunit